MIILIYLILGLIAGSFLNVVVLRLKEAETLMGRSRCPKCRKKIRWYDNIPLLSFILLGARCRDCKQKISWQYPAVELATGFLFSLIGLVFYVPGNIESLIETLYFLAIFSLLLIIFLYDFKFMEVPMIAVWATLGTIFLFQIISVYIFFYSNVIVGGINILTTLLGGVIAFSFFYLLSAGSKEKWMGQGDAYVALLVGLIAGWPEMLIALIFAFSAGSIYSIILMVVKKKTLQSRIPFAPFIVFGLFVEIILLKIFPEIPNYLFLV